MPTLGVVVASTREGRVGLRIADWVLDAAGRHGGFEASLIDLKTIDLPLLDEPNHPRLRKYTSPKTQAWSATVDALDSFVFVTPEYNFGSPPALINALDHLYVEWNYKAAGFVSYGGQSGGLRSVQMTKQIVTTLKMMPIVEAVAIPFVAQHLDKASGAFAAAESHETSGKAMLDELAKWTGALRTLRVAG
jgi:NAD(P)H-dependent FMN reductase